MLRRAGSTRVLGEAARGVSARGGGERGDGRGWPAINETDCRNDRTLGRDTEDKYMPRVLWKLLRAQRGVI